MPSISTGLATVALKWSPFALSFEPTVLARRTVTTVPAGRVTSLLPNIGDVAEAVVVTDEVRRSSRTN